MLPDTHDRYGYVDEEIAVHKVLHPRGDRGDALVYLAKHQGTTACFDEIRCLGINHEGGKAEPAVNL